MDVRHFEKVDMLQTDKSMKKGDIDFAQCGDMSYKMEG